jgi:hypothetical protein
MESLSLIRLFCEVDDFCQQFEAAWKPRWLPASGKKRHRKSRLSLSEVMTIIIAFHQSGYRTFKHFYLRHVSQYWQGAFPHLVSYHRFVEMMPAALGPLCLYLHRRRGVVTGIAFIDSTSIAVCHNRRIRSHRVFDGLAGRGKNSKGWFYGFKLHLVINERGELLAFKLTPGNVDDRKPVPDMTRELFGKLFGDRGYVSQKLFERLFANGVELITRLKKKMKNKLVLLMDKLLLRKRSLIETVCDQLKNISQLEHSRHRSVVNFMVNLVAGLIAYTYQDKKPSLNIRVEDFKPLPVFV